MSIPIGIRKDKNPTASALFGVAAIQGMVGVLGWYLHSGSFGWLDWVITFSSAIYIALGIAARWVRLPVALIGVGLYAAFLAFQALRSVGLLMSGFIFKIPVVVLLLVAVVFALRRSSAPPPLPAGEERV